MSDNLNRVREALEQIKKNREADQKALDEQEQDEDMREKLKKMRSALRTTDKYAAEERELKQEEQ